MLPNIAIGDIKTPMVMRVGACFALAYALQKQGKMYLLY